LHQLKEKPKMKRLRQKYVESSIVVLQQPITNSKVTHKSLLKTKITATLIILASTGLLTLSYMNGNIFIDKIAISLFIISCLLLIKLSGANSIKK
jgi:hypothetical protein